ncbi:MAG: T9SS type B sorting domain-containing protein [Bacteroidetes bacterium]|nr:T9SS type B sorting domain-containing protein [Bacteroidota bacterium]
MAIIPASSQPFRKAFIQILALASCLLVNSNDTSAQPNGLPWQVDPACQSIITNSIAAITCGTSKDVPLLQRYTFGLMNLKGVLPAAGRLDVSSQVEMYHHPSWRIDSIGNVFGITMDRCGNTYIAASSNYSSYFFFTESIIRYGDIGGGAESAEAAGTVYKIDGKTGQASVFSVLPQQVDTFFNRTCEGIINIVRNTGPGLGNLVFSHLTKQFYVTNFEDGRIYRLDENGNILDSYDPGLYDTGAPGEPNDLNDIPYGIELNADASKLYFGTCGYTSPTSGPLPKIYSIPLNTDGSFVGIINNTSLPAGATWDNYTGTETFQMEMGAEHALRDVIYLSDIEITPTGDMLVGGRMGCFSSLHSSYNHGGLAFLLGQNAGIYNNLIGVIYTGYPGSLGGSSEAYGGVSILKSNTGPALQFISSSADILNEDGPHGLCLVAANNFGSTGNPATPIGAISYGVVSNNGTDPKGVGGDVKVFVQCDCAIVCPTEIVATASDTVICSGSSISLGYYVEGGNSPVTPTWTDQNGNTIDPENVLLSNQDCAPATYTFTVTANCEEDPSIVLTDEVTIKVLATDILPFVSTVQEPCNIALNIDSACAQYLTVVGDIPVINAGDSGSVVLTVMTNDSLICASQPYTLNYNCPDCVISNLTAMPQECEDTTFLVEINLDANSVSDSFTVTDLNDAILGTFAYADLPALVGPLYGDSITTYTLTAVDAGVPLCRQEVTVGPQDCLPKCGFFEMPNAFSPNNDSMNDQFYPVSHYEFRVLDFKIYDRWGNIVHDSTEPWDGKDHDKDCISEVYVYIITVDTFCGVIKEHGDVTLVR